MRKSNKIKFICRNCGKCILDVPSSGRVYCSIQCKSKAQRKPILCVCEICGKNFEVFERYNYGNGARFCFQKCKSSQKIKKVCPQCGKIFKVKPSLLSQKFCSVKCKKENRYFERIRICKNCNKEFMVEYPCRNTKFCSKKCKNDYRKVVSICATCGKEFKHRPSVNRKFCSLECSNNVPEKIKKLVENTMKKISRGEFISKTELLLKDGLLGLGFVPQFISNYGSVDYAHTDKKIAVFVDGIFWHGREDNHWAETSFADKIFKTKIRDKIQNKKFKKDGWVVLRYWDDYVRSKTDECLNEITNIVNNR